MSDRINDDVAALLTPPPSKGVQFSQGIVRQWDNEFLSNQIEWRGITLTDVPIFEGINALVIREGDIVGMLGWAPENAKGVGSWWILGKISNPGEQVADLDITAKLIRFVTEDGKLLVFIGKEVDGDPLWMLMYGDDDESTAIRIADNNYIVAYDRDGHEVFATDGATHVGLAKPYLNIPMYPSSGTSVVVGGPFWPAFTNVNYQQVMSGITTLWHPRIRMGVNVSTSGGTVEWQLRLDGVVLASSSGNSSVFGTIPDWGTAITPGEQRSVELWARNTTGVQNRITVDSCYGLQS